MPVNHCNKWLQTVTRLSNNHMSKPSLAVILIVELESARSAQCRIMRQIGGPAMQTRITHYRKGGSKRLPDLQNRVGRKLPVYEKEAFNLKGKSPFSGLYLSLVN